MEDSESYLTNVYTPMLKNGLKLTFVKTPDPPNIEFSDVADHDFSIGSIPTGIIDSRINNTNYRKCIEAMEISKFDEEDLKNPFDVLNLKDLAKNKQKFTEESIKRINRTQDPLIDNIDSTTKDKIVKCRDEF